MNPTNQALVDQAKTSLYLVRWIVLGAIVGILAGISSWVFLISLDHVTSVRLNSPWLIYFLPLSGFLVAVVYHHFGPRSRGGNALIIDEIHEPSKWIPRRMAPFVFIGTIISHLFGASVGREGTAIQMSGSLTDVASRILKLSQKDRRVMLIASIAGGFGSVFGLPLAGTVFAMEVQSIGRMKYEAIVPALSASLVGDLIVRSLGYRHERVYNLYTPDDGIFFLKVAAAGVIFGLASIVFVELTYFIKHIMEKYVKYAPFRSLIGGVSIVALVALFGADYVGLSLPLIDATIAGQSVGIYVPILKIVFTAICLGSGFPGGEVTPLFVMGATLGAALAGPLGIPVQVCAALGFVAVFAGAANTPLAGTIMGAELFGAGTIGSVAIACIVSYIFSNHRGIYSTQRIAVAKYGKQDINGSSLKEIQQKKQRFRKDSP